jgi:hypothetical protein
VQRSGRLSLSFVRRLPNEQRQTSARPRVRAGVEQSSTIAVVGEELIMNANDARRLNTKKADDDGCQQSGVD